MQKKHLIPLVVSVLLLIGASIGARMFYSKTEALKLDITTLNGEVASLKNQAERLVSLRQVTTSTGDELLKLNDFFIAPSGALDFVKYIETLAGTSGLTFKIELFDQVADPVLAEQGKELLRTALRTTGTMKNTKIFLSLIESLPYNVKVTRVDLRRAGATEGTGTKDQWTALIDFTVVKVIEK